MTKKEYRHRYYLEHKEHDRKRNHEYYQNHREERVGYNQDWHKNNTKKWIQYFLNKYGKSPICGICGKKLKWKGDKNNVVCFDHRYNGKVFIKKGPMSWYRSRACNVSNQQIWEQCDFGILCNKCNKQLPTKNRLEWLGSITNYIKRTLKQRILEEMLIKEE